MQRRAVAVGILAEVDGRGVDICSGRRSILALGTVSSEARLDEQEKNWRGLAGTLLSMMGCLSMP